MDDLQPSEQLLINEMELLLSEQRTYLSILRTGIAVLILPASIIGFLVVTNQYHGLFDRIWVGATVSVILLGISGVGLWVSFSAKAKIDRINVFIARIRQENKRLAELVV